MNKNFDQWWDEAGYSALCAKNLESNNIKIGFDHELIVKEISRLAFNENLKPIDMQGAFVIVVERDNDKGSKINGSGPLVMETYPGRNSLLDTLERARGLNGRYGWTEICRLETLGNPDECEALMRERSKSSS